MNRIYRYCREYTPNFGEFEVLQSHKLRKKTSSVFIYHKKKLIFFQVAYNSIASEAGLRTRDYIVEINGQSVFGMNHNACKELIKRAGDRMTIKVER